jgi:hypothetical protein
MFVFKQFVDVNINYFVLGIGTLFVVRKIAKYKLDAQSLNVDDTVNDDEINNQVNQ